MARIKKRRIAAGGSEKVTALYQATACMKYFNLDPQAWRRLKRIDKKILQAFRIVEEYHLDLQIERSRAEHKKSDFVSRLPRQRLR